MTSQLISLTKVLLLIVENHAVLHHSICTFTQDVLGVLVYQVMQDLHYQQCRTQGIPKVVSVARCALRANLGGVHYLAQALKPKIVVWYTVFYSMVYYSMVYGNMDVI